MPRITCGWRVIRGVEKLAPQGSTGANYQARPGCRKPADSPPLEARSKRRTQHLDLVMRQAPPSPPGTAVAAEVQRDQHATAADHLPGLSPAGEAETHTLTLPPPTLPGDLALGPFLVGGWGQRGRGRVGGKRRWSMTRKSPFLAHVGLGGWPGSQPFLC